jgi:hypothetical protein
MTETLKAAGTNSGRAISKMIYEECFIAQIAGS